MSISVARELEVVAAGLERRSPHSRSTLSSSAADGSGGFGSVACSAASSSSSRASSGSSSLTRALTACISAIAAEASAPARLASPIAFAPALRFACASSSSGRSAFSRVRRSRAARSRSSDPSRRRASAASTGSGSRLIALRSSTTARGSRCPRPADRAPSRRRRPSCSATNSASASASSPTTMFCGIGPDEKPPLRIAYRTQLAVTLRWSKFGPSLYSRESTLVVDPSVPATLSVWQPEQRSTNSSADARWSSGTSMPFSPQAATAPPVAATATAISSERRSLVIGCDSIGERCPGPAPPSRSPSRPSRSPAAATPGRPCASGHELHRRARRLPDPPAAGPRAQGAAADRDRRQPRPARPHVPDPQRQRPQRAAR